MSKQTRILVVALSVVLIASVLGSGAALAQENETVTETPEDGDVEHVTVNGTDDGNETEYENGLDTDETEYDENETAEENETDDGNETEHQPFGQTVTAFVHGLLADSSGDTNATNDTSMTNVTNDENMTLGQQIAAFVVANNPGNAPDHAGPGGEKGPDQAGPPEHAGPGNETGKPADAGPGDETGQPDHAGPSGDEDASSDDDERGGGPPAHAGAKGGR